MKHILFVITLLAAIFLGACGTLPATAADPPAIVPATDSSALPTTPEQTTSADESEEAEIRALVENFGKRLQSVSLLAPNAAQEIQRQHSEFVSPALLETWMNDLSIAPGRIVSSPWPDRIEITAFEKVSSGKYMITGSVIEVTSTEVNSGETANQTPVRIVVEKVQGRWIVVEYAQQP
jgi:hypothetical protein